MKTIALILACVSAMVCFDATAGVTDSSKAWYLYEDSFIPTPVSADNYVEDIDKTSCTCRGKKMYGKVKIVENWPDIKVKIVESFPDLKVKTVSSFPDDCGEWQFVESFPDFTIKFVESFPDLEIKFVESFPGM